MHINSYHLLSTTHFRLCDSPQRMYALHGIMKISDFFFSDL
jgi:hypothetical protein